MPSRRSSHPASMVLLAATVLAAGLACSDRTAPDGAPAADSRPSMTALLTLPSAGPSIRSVTFKEARITLGGAATPYMVALRNPGPAQTLIYLQGEIVQGSATRGAGGFSVACPNPDGILPNGSCTMQATATASHATGGTGVLVPGPATLVLHLLRSDGVTTTALDGTVVSVTLVAP